MPSMGHLSTMQGAISGAILKMETTISQALGAQTAALQGATSSSSDMINEALSNQTKNQIHTETQKDVNRFLTREIPVNGVCDNFAPGTALMGVNVLLGQGNRMLAETDRNLGQGFFTSAGGTPTRPKGTKDIWENRVAMAQAVEQNPPQFTHDPVFTEKQWAAWNAMTTSLMPEMLLPKGDLSGAARDAYTLEQTRAREMRTLLTQAFRDYGADRYAAIPAEPIYQWAGNVPKPVVVEPVVDSNGGSNPVQTNNTARVIGANEKISRGALFDLVGKRYMSQDFVAKINAMDSPAVLKEQLRLQSFAYAALLDIRSAVKYNNMLKAMELIPVLESLTRGQAALSGTVN